MWAAWPATWSLSARPPLPINQFTQQSNFLLAALAGAERVFEAMDEPPEVDEGTTDLVNVREEDGT